MSNFRFDSRLDGGRGGRDSYDKPRLHDAICNECGKDCKVPFRPSGSKPVFCSECFEQKGGGGRDLGRPRFDGRGSGGGASGPDLSRLTKGIDSLNNKLDQIIGLLKPPLIKSKKGEVAKMVDSLKKSDAELKRVKPKKVEKAKK